MKDTLRNQARIGILVAALATLLEACAFAPRPVENARQQHSKGRAGSSREHRERQPKHGKRLQPQLSSEEILGVLDLHNRVRREVGVGKLAWSEELASYAQDWATQLASRGCVLEHRPTSGKWKRIYGENLYMRTMDFASPGDAIASWADEKTDYRGGPITRNRKPLVGHYTQIVWRDTEAVGCGKVECEDYLIVVCNYDPPGNVVGRRPY